jgi:hypothetical protein
VNAHTPEPIFYCASIALQESEADNPPRSGIALHIVADVISAAAGGVAWPERNSGRARVGMMKSNKRVLDCSYLGGREQVNAGMASSMRASGIFAQIDSGLIGNARPQ